MLENVKLDLNLQKPGTVCNGCYALKGCYVFPVVKDAMARRLEFFNSKDFIPIMVWLLQSQRKSFLGGLIVETFKMFSWV